MSRFNVMPRGLRRHLWYRRQLRRSHIMRPLSPPSRCSQCDAEFSQANPVGWPSGICLNCQGVPIENRWWLHTDTPPTEVTR